MLKVIKIGGNIVDNPEKLEAFLNDFAHLSGKKILVHGGGKVATTISKALGIETQMIGGTQGYRRANAQSGDNGVCRGNHKTIVGRIAGRGAMAVG